MNSKYLYWGSTGLIAVFALLSGGMYFIAEAPAETIQRLGYPDYLRVLLGAGKLVGGAILLFPLPRWIKEWAYAGFTIDFSMALISHAVVGDPVSAILRPAIALGLLWTSYVMYHRYMLTATHATEE